MTSIPHQLYQQPALQNNTRTCKDDEFGMTHFSTQQGSFEMQVAPLPKGKVTEEKKKPFLPLCAARLKPIRQKTKNAVVSVMAVSLQNA